ncbi:MAG: AtpZ/AtpI family protein [Chloroflexi bacterium]|jgi:F0F1-type ATP synthase assembly protein I|nr:AtpZ/AtpI family protein [Chloroflexota bacterium]MCX6039164.1 AtpZ/AtpI family protein [Chloroflexota bacterium]MDP2994778.1 AtpZ/AtpI family protein [Anaerolineales bacterium]
MGQSNDKGQDEFRTAVTMTVVWVAGLTLVVIFAALFAGLWLDKILDSKPLFTIVLVLVSIPVTLFLTFRVVRAATARIQPAIKKDVTEEEPHRGEDS